MNYVLRLIANFTLTKECCDELGSAELPDDICRPVTIEGIGAVGFG